MRAVSSLHALQFAALLGDLQQKFDLYIHYQDYSMAVACRFSNYHQATYLLDYHPELVPDGHWSEHSLGTFFEYYYYSNLTFRLEYLRVLPSCGHGI